MSKKEAVLIVVKPDGMTKSLLPQIFERLDQTRLELVAAKVLQVPKALAMEHYKHIQGQPFYDMTIKHMLGQYHRAKKVLAMIYYGPGAIKKCREMAGATNPEEANPNSIRGAFGCVTPKGIFENVLHVSSEKKEAAREIKLWFSPDDISMSLYRTKSKRAKTSKQRVWA